MLRVCFVTNFTIIKFLSYYLVSFSSFRLFRCQFLLFLSYIIIISIQRFQVELFIYSWATAILLANTCHIINTISHALYIS